jgi:hypothetical protein
MPSLDAKKQNVLYKGETGNPNKKNKKSQKIQTKTLIFWIIDLKLSNLENTNKKKWK